MKKCLPFLAVLLLFSVTLQIYASVTLSSEVPASHTVTVVGRHIQVTCDGRRGTCFSVKRLSEPKLHFSVDRGYQLKQVLLNGKDITAQVRNNAYTVTDLYEDKVLSLTTVRTQNNSITVILKLIKKLFDRFLP